MESILVCGGLVDIQLTQADSHGGCLSIPLFNYTPSAHLIKLPINSIKPVSRGYLRDMIKFLHWSKVSAMVVLYMLSVRQMRVLC